MLDIFKLYDQLKKRIGDYYAENNQGGRFGRVKGISTNSGEKYQSKFYQQTLDYSTPIAFLYPILGAFRALVDENDNGYYWLSDPFEMMDKVGKELVNTTVDRSRSLGNNPNAVGKDTGNWKTLYMIVRMRLLVS